MITKYGERASVIYKYTDSLFYNLKTTDVHKNLIELINEMDFSDYPLNHFLFSIVKKKVPLKLCDELSNCIIAEAALLKPKAYSVSYNDSDIHNSKRSAKGVNFAPSLHHDSYNSV